MQESRVGDGYRGRVRTGCLTCRSRKIKCDEKLPTCHNCGEKRSCVYKPRKTVQPWLSAAHTSPGNATLNESARLSKIRSLPKTYSGSQPIFEDQNSVPADKSQHASTTKILWRADDPELDVTLPSTLISRDTDLTTTMDILTASEVSLQLSFSFFVEAVECPSITPYDGVNWQQMKLDMVQLGSSNTTVASAIIALSTLYKGLLYSLPLSKALSLYHSSKNTYEKLLNDETQDFGIILAATFLLCLFQFIHYETVPILREPSDEFLDRLKIWAQNESSHSELSLRIIVWLRILFATTIRGGGGMGLVSESLCSLFPCYKTRMSNLRLSSDRQSDTSTQLFQMLSTPIFEFYFQLQLISGDLAKLTHYHRSRTTGIDQEEVVQQTTLIKARLHALWSNRSATQSQTPEDLRSHFAPHIANPMLSLIGVCNAAYHAEIVEMDRVVGDPVSESTDSKQAMCRIREIVDGDWNAYDRGKLNPGYIRPLFLYAIECMNHDENQWAVERLGQIKNMVYRSDFFASFGKTLSEAQLQKRRRVSSKYFCIWYFGVPPPFM